jgi:hypothetical protein
MIPNDRKAPVQSGLPPAPGYPDSSNPSGTGIRLSSHGTRGAVKGGEKVGHRGGGIVYHPHDEKELNWEPGGVRSGAGVCKSGVSQESSGSSETWDAAFPRLCRRR